MDSVQDTSKRIITLKQITGYSNKHTKVTAKNLNDDFNYETEDPLILRIKILNIIYIQGINLKTLFNFFCKSLYSIISTAASMIVSIFFNIADFTLRPMSGLLSHL